MRSLRIVPVLCALASVLAVAVALRFILEAKPSDYGTLGLGTLIISGVCGVWVFNVWKRDLTAAPTLYVVIFSLFHFGVIWTLWIGGLEPVRQVSPYGVDWIGSQMLPRAVWLASIGLLVFSCVALVLRPRAAISPITDPDHPEESSIPTATNARLESSRIGTVGEVLMILGALGLSPSLVAQGLSGLFGGQYVALLDTSQSSAFGYGIWMFALGSCLTQVGTSAHRRKGLVGFVVFGAVLFAIGLRGTVLFPAAVMLCLRGATGPRLRVRVLPLLVGSVAVLTLSSIVRLTRVGLGLEAQQGPWYSPITSSVTELGFTLRPTVEVLGWQATNPHFTHFVSLVAVPIRTIERLTGWHGGPPTTDYRLFNVKVNALVGPIGGSPIAEGYDSAGTLGVILLMAGLAVTICLLARRPPTARNLANFAVVLLPLMIAVRNSFAPVPVQIGLGLVMVAVLGRRAAAPPPSPTSSIAPRGSPQHTLSGG